jgi:phosphoribosylaminoimidazole-succinocarboxamide synthase
MWKSRCATWPRRSAGRAEAAEGAYEDAGIRGLCAEGRREMALQAIRRVDVEAVVRNVAAGARSESSSMRTDPSHP